MFIGESFISSGPNAAYIDQLCLGTMGFGTPAWRPLDETSSSTLFAVESVAQMNEQIAALEMHLTPEELHSIDRQCTPCSVINDHVKRIPRTPGAG